MLVKDCDIAVSTQLNAAYNFFHAQPYRKIDSDKLKRFLLCYPNLSGGQVRRSNNAGGLRSITLTSDLNLKCPRVIAREWVWDLIYNHIGTCLAPG